MAFTPPYPRPHKSKSSLLLRFFRGWHSWLHVLFEKSYCMKMGHVHQRGVDVYMVNEPSWVRRILEENASRYPKHPLMHQILEPLLGSSIFTTNGPVWERQRRLVDQAFAQARLQMVFPRMTQAVDAMLERLDLAAEPLGTGNPGRSFEVDAEMTCVTADVMFRTILSERLEENDAHAIYEAFLDFQNQAQKAAVLMLYRLPAFFPRRASRKSAQKIREILSRIIARRFASVRQAGEIPLEDREALPQDILAGLMEAVDPVSQDRFTYEEVTDQVCMLFLAGHETSASALAWSLYLVSHSPEIQERMVAEIRREVGEGEFAYGDTRRLRLVWNVFREALRLYPPVGFFVREAAETHEIRDKKVGKGCPILLSPWLIHRHRELWERPDVFDPDRFDTLEGKESTRCAYIPFSAGPRVCVGAAFATQEAVLVLASIVRRYHITPEETHQPEPVGRVTIRSGNGIRVRLSRRAPAGEAASFPEEVRRGG
jgi:cytochrome P450